MNRKTKIIVLAVGAIAVIAGLVMLLLPRELPYCEDEPRIRTSSASNPAEPQEECQERPELFTPTGIPSSLVETDALEQANSRLHTMRRLYARAAWICRENNLQLLPTLSDDFRCDALRDRRREIRELEREVLQESGVFE